MNLYNQILIKNNHIIATNNITQTIHTTKLNPKIKLIMEIDTLAQLNETLTKNVDQILLTPLQLHTTKQKPNNKTHHQQQHKQQHHNKQTKQHTTIS